MQDTPVLSPSQRIEEDRQSADPVELVLSRLPGFSKAGNEWVATCPVHKDSKPSLAIARGKDGRALLHCFAGCPVEAIVAALGLQKPDLFADRPAPQNGAGRIRRWPIVDATGETVAIHVRRDSPEGKKFHWERPDGQKGLGGIRTRDLPLYGLPKVIAAAVETPIVLAEGEKAADSLIEAGLLAVGSVTGAGGTPSDESLRPLMGRPIVLWPDSDDPGREHMARIARRLRGLGVGFLRWVEIRDAKAGDDSADVPPDKRREAIEAARPWEDVRGAEAGDEDGVRVEPGQEPDDFQAFGSEMWFGRRIVAEHGDDLRYVQTWKKWLMFDEASGRWVEDEGAVWRAAKKTARDLLREAEGKLATARATGDKSDIDKAKEWIQAARRFFARTPLANAVALASSEPEVQATADQWDADPYLFAVGGGRVVELRAGTARAARREDSLTKGTDVPFDPHAKAPTWDRFLARVLPEPGIRTYVQRFVGYSAIGEIREHVLLIFHGGGRNGKGTFTETVGRVMGAYATVIPVAVLLESRGDRHPTELADLCGRRLVTCSEAPESGRLSEERVKSLTGGDRIKARRMREDFWYFVPAHKIILATNHRPRITGGDLGIWRRVRLVPWEVTIAEDEEDVELPAKLRAEAPGILAWIVAGAVEYLRDGLRPPKTVRDATAAYREAEDVLGEFLVEHVVESPGAFLATKPLHARFLEWAAEAGIPEPWGQRTLTRKLKDRGWKYSTSPRGWPGMSLKPPRSERETPVDFKVESSRKSSYGNPRSERGHSKADPYDPERQAIQEYEAEEAEDRGRGGP
ncbi:MAG: hypothetical protein HY720_03860 [Planctomycetes bacterium]|nr:hypothetical protein [Planctomycetota bacterium]